MDMVWYGPLTSYIYTVVRRKKPRALGTTSLVSFRKTLCSFERCARTLANCQASVVTVYVLQSHYSWFRGAPPRSTRVFAPLTSRPFGTFGRPSAMASQSPSKRREMDVTKLLMSGTHCLLM